MEFDISVIVPFLNEKDNLERLVFELNNYFSSLVGLKVEVIFVDDGSEDGSLELLKKLDHVSYKARVIKLSKNFGSHSALRSGVMQAKSPFITFMYVDLQDPLDLILKMYNKCKMANDIVWATRNSTNVGLIEKLFSKMYAKLMQKYVIKTFPENGFDIVMFNEKVKNELNQNIETNSSIFLQILTLGFKQEVITYDKQARKVGKSKWTLSQKIKLVIDSFVAFSYTPIRFVSILGIILSLTGFIVAIYIIFRAVFAKDLNQGWPTLISVLMMGFGVTNISLGIIAEYLWRTLDASRKRKVYIIDEVTDI